MRADILTMGRSVHILDVEKTTFGETEKRPVPNHLRFIKHLRHWKKLVGPGLLDLRFK